MGNFEKLQINEETYHYKNEKRFVSTSLEPTSVPLTVRKPAGLSVEFQSKQSLIDDQIRAFQVSNYTIYVTFSWFILCLRSILFTFFG